MSGLEHLSGRTGAPIRMAAPSQIRNVPLTTMIAIRRQRAHLPASALLVIAIRSFASLNSEHPPTAPDQRGAPRPGVWYYCRDKILGADVQFRDVSVRESITCSSFEVAAGSKCMKALAASIRHARIQVGRPEGCVVWMSSARSGESRLASGTSAMSIRFAARTLWKWPSKSLEISDSSSPVTRSIAKSLSSCDVMVRDAGGSRASRLPTGFNSSAIRVWNRNRRVPSGRCHRPPDLHCGVDGRTGRDNHVDFARDRSCSQRR